MVKKNLTKIFIGCLMLMFMIGVVNITAYADVYYEGEKFGDKGTNDTRENAEMIESNKSTPAKQIVGDTSGERVVKGNTSTLDIDWFKVFLTAGDRYFTCNGSGFNFQVTDKHGQILLEESYVKTGDGPTAYALPILTADYYYVKITGRSSSNDEYLFLVGNPCYAVSVCGIPCKEGTISMSQKGETQTAHFEGTNVSGIPKDAIAYQIKMSGVKTTTVNSITVNNENAKSGFRLKPYVWTYTGLVALKLPVESTWSATFEYFKTISFTPVLTVNYVYPIYYKMKQ